MERFRLGRVAAQEHEKAAYIRGVQLASNCVSRPTFWNSVSSEVLRILINYIFIYGFVTYRFEDD